MGTSIPDLAANFADLSNDWEKRVILGMYFVRLFEVLSEEEKTLVELYYLERLSTEVMAELMDITVPAFKSKILRIRRRLEAQTEYLDQPPKGDRRQKLAGLFSGTAAER
jgi:DNA-directed RNA polymerase specialized sigma24 family protein